MSEEENNNEIEPQNQGDSLVDDDMKQIAQEQLAEVRMSFGDHLEELRSCLLQALIGIAVILAFTLMYGRGIAGWITQPLMRALYRNELPQEVIAQSVTDAFGVYVKVSIGAAVVIGIPWIIYQVWRFVAPGLYDHEKKVVSKIGPASALLTLIAVSFMYTMLLPVSANFLVKWSTGYPLPAGEKPGVFEFLNDALDKFTPGPGNRKRVPVNETEKTDDDNKTDESASTGAGATPSGVSTTGEAITSPESSQANSGQAGVAPAPAQSAFIIPRLDKDPASPLDGQLWFNTQKRTICLYVNGAIQVYQPAANSMLRPMITLTSWVNFVVTLAIAVSIGFQLPILMLVIGWSKAVDPKLLAKGRRFAFMGILIGSAILTPADPVSMVILAGPMCLLFELGLWLMRKSFGDGEVYDGEREAE